MTFCPTHKKLLRREGGVAKCPVPGCTFTGAGGAAAPAAAARGKVAERAKLKTEDGAFVIVDATQKMDLLPTTEEYKCEKCGNGKAYYYMRQTRSADEATTRFLECTKCAYKWREYR